MTEKSEITKLPEGKSSEEIDAWTTEEEEQAEDTELAKEALDATEEPSPAEETVEVETEAEKAAKEAVEEAVVKPPEELSEEQQQLRAKDSKIASLKKTNREIELEKARLEGKLEAQKELQTKTEEAPKSPIEIAEADYIAQYGSLPEGGLPMTGALYRAQKAFDDEQSASKIAADKEERSSDAMNKSIASMQSDELSVEKAGDGLDFKSVVGIGQHYLDKADLLKISIVSSKDGIDAAVRKTYELCKDAILAANNADSKLLQSAIDAKGKTQTEPTKETTNIDALTTEDEETETGEPEPETLSIRLANFICEPE